MIHVFITLSHYVFKSDHVIKSIRLLALYRICLVGWKKSCFSFFFLCFIYKNAVWSFLRTCLSLYISYRFFVRHSILFLLHPLSNNATVSFFFPLPEEGVVVLGSSSSELSGSLLGSIKYHESIVSLPGNTDYMHFLPLMIYIINSGISKIFIKCS